MSFTVTMNYIKILVSNVRDQRSEGSASSVDTLMLTGCKGLADDSASGANVCLHLVDPVGNLYQTLEALRLRNL